MINKNLPEKFLVRMKNMLGEEFECFLNCFDSEPKKGIRLNTLKCSKEKLESLLSLENAPTSELSYFYEGKVGAMPLHAAGAFYSQEPSASSAVTVLDPKPGDFVLDMCAAPGGKSTQIASLLEGEGLIWSNEVIKSRANILLSNMERMGVRNAVISSAYPDVLSKKLGGFFDKVLVDAPCSGEGMFRKNDEAIAEWSEEHVKSCAERQLEIMKSASNLLKKDGILVYSTCTFSMEENEELVKKFLEACPEYEKMEINVPFGRKAFDNKSLSLFPMDEGEGHFVANFRRIAENYEYRQLTEYKEDKKDIEGAKLFKELFNIKPWGVIKNIGDKFVIMPQNKLPDFKGITILRAGVILSELVGKHSEPHHSLFAAAKPCEVKMNADFKESDETLHKYLKGEEIDVDEKLKGYTLVSVEGVALGFGKASGGRLKNKYPKGLRIVS